MDAQELTDFLKENPAPTKEDAHSVASRPWYNKTGDCIEYQTEQVAIVADRIDDYLTIYRSAEDDSAVGFQLKDVSALMRQYRANVFGVKWQEQNQKVISVSSLLLTALETTVRPWTMGTRHGYDEVMRSLSSDSAALEMEDEIMA